MTAAQWIACLVLVGTFCITAIFLAWHQHIRRLQRAFRVQQVTLAKQNGHFVSASVPLSTYELDTIVK